MADWPPVAPVQAAPSSREREQTYLLLVDMFVDIVEPDIIQMVLQNRNWDVDAAIEDIMILANSSQSESAQYVSQTSTALESNNQQTAKKGIKSPLQDENKPPHKLSSPSNAGKMFSSPQNDLQSRPKKQMPLKPAQSKTSDLKNGNMSQLQPFLEQYSYIKATKGPFNRAVMLIRDGVKVMIILRGPPGSGKSCLAKKLLLESGIEPSAHKRHIFSSDEFFVQNNVYVFVPELLSQAHLWNQRSVASAIREEVSPVIVDNTNTQAWEMRVYAEMAVTAGYDLEILEPDTWWFKKEGELAKRNVHGVPKAKIRQMLERYERNITPDNLMKAFDLRYAMSKSPPQPARNCKWRDKLSSQRNNKPKKKKSDCSLKSQTNLGNFNTMFEALQINSTNNTGFQVENDLSIQNSSTTNFSFPPQSNTNEISEKENQYFFNGITSKEDLTHSSYRNGESTNGVYIDESDTNKLFDNLMDSSNSFLESLSGHKKSSRESSKISNQTRGDINSENLLQQSKDPFDFMAETKKLLEALNKPSSSNSQTLTLGLESSQEILNQSRGNEKTKNVEWSKVFEPGRILVCKENEILLTAEQLPNKGTEFNQTINVEEESNPSTEENIMVAHDLVNSIIDEAVNDTKDVVSKNQCCVNPNAEGDKGLSWDYVVVNNDKTFTYQRKNSIPLGLPVVITDSSGSTCSHFMDNTSLCCETSPQCKSKSRNVHAAFYNDNSKSNLSSNEHESLDVDCKNDSNINSVEELKCWDYKSVSITEEIGNQLHSREAIFKGVNQRFAAKKEDVILDSTTNCCEQKTVNVNKTEDKANNDNPNVFDMMKEFLCTLGPLNDGYTSFVNNVSSNVPEASTSNNNNESQNFPAKPSQDSSSNLNSRCNWEFETSDSQKNSQPKPARELRRPKLLTSVVTPKLNENDYTKFLGNWDTVSNPLKTWDADSESQPLETRNEAYALPQRPSPQRSKNKKMINSSTNTNYLDFSLTGEENLSGVKVLTGNINNVFPESFQEVKQSMAETLFLDKSTMTSNDSIESARNYDITQITSLFPNIPEKYILDMVERCQGDIDWAVDLLLDSEHNMSLVSVECEETLISRRSDDEVEHDPNQQQSVINQNDYNKASSKRELKSPSDEQAELKKLLENSVFFDKSHYSDKVLKVLKRKHPEYANLIENNLPEDANKNKLETAENSQEECKTEDEVDDIDEGSSSSGCDVETEDDTMDLVMTNDLILQLQQKFGTSPLPKIGEMTPIVKLPLSFARQLFGYIMDSLQSDMDEQQSFIEEMIAKDEEVARLLQFQDQNSRPQLQEVMDMEIALAMHRADQEELKDKGNETLAAKLSKNILVEKFPQVDPKMLAEVLQAHNYSLADTIDSLTLGLGIGPRTAPHPPLHQPKEEKERVTSIIVSDEVGATGPAASGVNPASEAAVHRAQAASYYSLRMECLSKAHDAFRSGNKTVATYYSQLAQMHKERMEQSNSKAAACLFSSHKTGNNTLDLHFLHIREAEVVLDMFLDEVVTDISERNKRHQTVFLITGRGLRSVGGVSRIKPMVQRKLQGRGIPYNEVNPGMLSALVRNVTPLSYTL